MKSDPDVLKSKLAIIRDRLSFLDQEHSLGRFETAQAVKHSLQEAIEACLDIANHIISAEGLGEPASYSAYFTKLRQAGILDSELAERLQDMARFRNVLVHLYADVDRQAVQDILDEGLGDIRSFAQAIYSYLDTAE